MIAAVLLAALLRPQLPATDGMLTLATFRMGGRDVPAKVPSGEGPLTNEGTVEFGGWNYAIDDSGSIMRRFKASGGWSEVRALFEEAAPKLTAETPVWRVKVFVLGRADVLDHGPDGLLRVRRGRIEGRQIDGVLESIARFGAMVQAYGQGRLRVSFDLEYDGDWNRETAKAGMPRPFGAEFMSRYVAPRINGGAYEAEDRVYRGPWDSVFVLHAAPASAPGLFRVLGTPVTVISVAADAAIAGPLGLSALLYQGWLRHGLAALRKHGTPISDFEPERSMRTDAELRNSGVEVSDSGRILWDQSLGKVWNRTAPTSEAYTARWRTSREAGARPWTEVESDPLASLAKIDAAWLEGRAGSPIRVEHSPEAPLALRGASGSSAARSARGALDAEMRAGESMALLGLGGRSLLFVSAEFAAFAASRLPSGSLAAGWLEASGRVFIAFDIAAPSARTEAELLGLSPGTQRGPPGTSRHFDPAAVKDVVARGSFRIAAVRDDERGEVLEVTYGALPRTGAVTLIGSRFGLAIATPESHRFLALTLRATNPEPMELALIGEGGSVIGSCTLLGDLPMPAEFELQNPSPRLAVDASGEWTRVAIDVQALAMRVGMRLDSPITAVELRSHPYAGFWESVQLAADPTIHISEVAFSAQSPGELTKDTVPVAAPSAPASADPLARARFAALYTESSPVDAAAKLAALLKDPKDVVRINAAAAYRRVKSPSAETALIADLASLDPRVSEQVSLALLFQETPAALAALKRAVEIGPFDHSREMAARALAARKDPKLIGTLSTLFSAASWQCRLVGAEALGTIPTREAAIVQLVFLQELDPLVRLAVIRSANPDYDLVGRRLLWCAVNDPSDLVRAESYLKLLHSPNPALASEGAKGVRDDSGAVRLLILERLRQSPTEAGRPALRLAVADVAAEVRAEALLAFVRLAGPVSLEEVQNTLLDPDPRVRSAFDELARVKGLARP